MGPVHDPSKMGEVTMTIGEAEAEICETTPLLGTRQSNASCDTLPESPGEEAWQPPRGFWWIEVALWANVYLSGFDSTITASTYALISSDFSSANYASWLTTSYLITSTAFQPLYGRFSDVFGRRICFFVSTAVFSVGCLGCGVAPSMSTLNLMRALTGLGGGGLITMATVINSDMIPFQRRGMYQAMQNILFGLGAAMGASFGGIVAEGIGWRWCFLLQVPVSVFAFAVGYKVLVDSPEIFDFGSDLKLRTAMRQIDLPGAFVLVLGLVTQLAGLSLGGNEYPWVSVPVIGSLVASCALLCLFVVIEMKTQAIPVIPLRMLRGCQPVVVQLTNVFSGMAAYAYLIMMPLYFQAVRGDSPTAAGLRLAIPCLATPVGGVIAGSMMQRRYRLSHNVRWGTAMMLLGNALAMAMDRRIPRWTELVFLVPANLGLGLTNPSVLFSFVSLFEHKEQAVATSTVYWIRSMGAIYGTTIASAIVQNVLVERLSSALALPADAELIKKLQQSVFALHDLPPEIQALARSVYADALRIAFAASTAFALLSFIFSWVARTGVMQRKS